VKTVKFIENYALTVAQKASVDVKLSEHQQKLHQLQANIMNVTEVMCVCVYADRMMAACLIVAM